MTLIFDRNSEGQRTLPCDRVYFRGTEGVVQSVYDTTITQASDIPDLSDFIDNPGFTTLHIDNGTVVIPVTGVNYIRDITGNLYGDNYNLTVTMGDGE